MSRVKVYQISCVEQTGKVRNSTFSAMTALDLATKIRMYCGDASVIQSIKIVTGVGRRMEG